ncbi:hypothetical protein SAMN06295974_1501 [Plantibacter flavus]|uniref:Uncharacterized protein n=1 Tax=Plantibacter flavus TaxID=150123 RepID=A0A3N2C7D6_9MICO|nr:hypothetical protein [Plantibacter flavus]ROR83433.1 hypothetical protein EDD42_3544 [Plantibacter flavus]SMG23413.1 hypothetical protein SAMN06295974_1501 [Plantibacter flavus]
MIVAAVAVAVFGGVLIASPPWSILGALVLVAASIVFATGVVATYRRSWAETWPPDATPTRRQQLRRLAVGRVLGSVLVVGTIGLAAFAILRQDWTGLVFAVILCASGVGNLVLNRRVLQQLREGERAET